MRELLLASTLALLAAWWAWPGRGGDRDTFALPGSFDVKFPHGEGVARSLYTLRGRICALSDVIMVVTPFVDPVWISADELEGPGELRLGPPEGSGASLRVGADGLELRVRGATEASQRFAVQPRSVMLQHLDGRYTVIADGRTLEPSLPGEGEAEPAALMLSAFSSVRRLTVGNTGGEVRVIEDPDPDPGLLRVAWAVGSVLLLYVALRRWLLLVVGEESVRGADRLAGTACTLGLALGLVATLDGNNAERLGMAPAPCDEQPYRLPSARHVAPGETCDVPLRRDGDFRLTAEITLEPDSAVDVLLRSTPPSMDQQILLTLSSSADLPSGLARNRGLFLQGQPASEVRRQLPAGRPLVVEVQAVDATVEASVDGQPLGRISDFDLRAGRTAVHALWGGATVGSLAIEPIGQPRALLARLRAWEFGAAALAVLGVLYMARRSGRGWAAALAVAPLAVVAQPLAPAAVLVPGLLLALLLLGLTARRGGRILTLAAGAALIGLTAWAQGEKPPAVTQSNLNQLRPCDVGGPPIPDRAMWARHPLCRRFNSYLRTQTFRDRRVALRRPEGSVRIATIGSSSTFGYGVPGPQSFSSQLELLLREPGRDVEVVNAGVPGATAERLLRFLKGVVLPLQPDFVIIDLGFNDHVAGPACDEREYFARMASDGIGWPQQLWRQLRDGRLTGQSVDYREAAKVGGSLDPEAVQHFEAEPAQRFAATLRDMVAACRAAGAQVILVEEPVREGAGDRILDAFHAAMAALGAELGVPVAEPQAALDRVGGALFVDRNRDAVHPNAVGHRIIARVLAEIVEPLLRAPR